MLRTQLAIFGTVVCANPIYARQDSTSDTCTASSTSQQWLSICETSIFWPTSTDYYYGPTTGPKASAVSCNAEWVEYHGRATGLRSLGVTATSTYTTTYEARTGVCYTQTETENYFATHTGPVTTLCDGIPRALGPLESSIVYGPDPTGECGTSTGTATRSTWVYRSPSPTPSCQLNTADCIAIWSTYSSLSSSYSSYTESASITTSGDIHSPIKPDGCPSTSRNYTVKDPCTDCHYAAGTATMYYWPVTTVNGDLCAQNGSTITPTPTGEGPNTAVVDGRTFSSPTIYVSFPSIYANSNQRVHPGGHCGADYENVMISAEPDAFTSYRDHLNAKYVRVGTPFPFEYDEFQLHTLGTETMSLIPWDKYQGGEQCPGTCTMVRNDYSPIMGFPDVMSQIDPRWTSCLRSRILPGVTMVPLVGKLAPGPTGVPDAASLQPSSAVPESGLIAPTPLVTGGSLP
ncbi:hypothetical protein BDV59DRAFT_209217 [Aspergillus ambiguus]|uniref:uncharacterized protein n=1 Tax=Aspergillus ambiguus TaxID=176160 RepID=UPI003CCE06B9